MKTTTTTYFTFFLGNVDAAAQDAGDRSPRKYTHRNATVFVTPMPNTRPEVGSIPGVEEVADEC